MEGNRSDVPMVADSRCSVEDLNPETAECPGASDCKGFSTLLRPGSISSVVFSSGPVVVASIRGLVVTVGSVGSPVFAGSLSVLGNVLPNVTCGELRSSAGEPELLFEADDGV